eukprot:3061579-Rhodomonas_salina.1
MSSGVGCAFAARGARRSLANATARNQRAATSSAVQSVPALRRFVFDFAVQKWATHLSGYWA